MNEFGEVARENRQRIVDALAKAARGQPTDYGGRCEYRVRVIFRGLPSAFDDSRIFAFQQFLMQYVDKFPIIEKVKPSCLRVDFGFESLSSEEWDRLITAVDSSAGQSVAARLEIQQITLRQRERQSSDNKLAKRHIEHSKQTTGTH